MRGQLSQTEVHSLLLQDATAVEHAMIPVERINGPVLLFSGELDEEWPSASMSRMVMERLAGHYHPFSDEHISYSDAGHAFPEPAYRDAWSRTLTFLRDALPGAASP
jgi:dienelactone hydrolase